MHTSQLKPTAQLVVQVYNEILDLALIQQALDCSYLAEKQVTREHWVKMKKGQKSNSTKFLEQRQKSYNPVIIINNIPLGWTPQCVVIEGMFIINTSPLGTHRAYGEYALLTL